MRSGFVFNNNYVITAGNAAPNTALADANYPASGSFIDVSKYERFHIVVHMGTLADALTYTVQAANAANGTPADVDATNLAIVAADDDDGEYLCFTVETAALPQGSEFVSLEVDGVSGSNYASITFYLEEVSLPASNSNVTAAVSSA